MSDHYSNTSGERANVSDEQLDLLVDGELGREEYRQLLAALDNDPEGWRRCAMAFLESQALAHDLTAHELAEIGGQSPPRPVLMTTSGASSRLFFCATVAASWLVAFGLGLNWRDGWAHLSPPGIARSLPDPFAVDQDREADVTSTSPTDSISDARITDARINDAWGQVTLIVDGDDGTAQEISLPVFRQRELQDDWFEKVADVPPPIQRDLRRLGYQVRGDINWEPVELEQGQRVVFPMRAFEITPVSMLFQ